MNDSLCAPTRCSPKGSSTRCACYRSVVFATASPRRARSGTRRCSRISTREATERRPVNRRSSASAATCADSGRGSAATIASPGSTARTPTTSSTRWRYGGTYPDQVMFAKGHGTQNDFVLLPDLDARLALEPAAVDALCDRRRGLGADGILRVTTAGAAAAAGIFDRLPEGVAAGDWYMDYRNADGSIAQMCGNGA